MTPDERAAWSGIERSFYFRPAVVPPHEVPVIPGSPVSEFAERAGAPLLPWQRELLDRVPAPRCACADFRVRINPDCPVHRLNGRPSS